VSLEPTAVTQSPTARALAPADCVSLYVVDPCNPIVTVVLLIDVGGVELSVLLRDPRNPEEEMPYITRLEGLMDVTLPLAKLNPLVLPVADPDEPLGRLPPLGTLPPFGGVPPLSPPPPPGPPAPKPPVVQLPEEVGLLTMTALATSVPVEVDPVTVTQSPATTFAADTTVVFVKVVDDVQLTVT
jgi:hypothetical protein